MDTQIQRFEFSNYGIRTIISPTGEVYFVAQDVCKVLETNNVGQAISRLDEDEKTTIILNEYGRDYEKPIITESGLYSLVLSSRKPEAKAFKKWVTSEVLPAIRKTGKYEPKALSPAELILMQAQQLVATEAKLQEHDARLAAIEARSEESAEYLNDLRQYPAQAKLVDTRKAIDTIVKNYAASNNIEHGIVWGMLYIQASLRLHKNVKQSAKKAKLSQIAWLE
jgi:prophage antirepressor-like protein